MSPNPDMFQRFGGVGIVLGVLLYAVSSPPVLHPMGQIEAQKQRDLTAIEIANSALVANFNVSLLAATFQKVLEDEGKIVPNSVVALAKPAKDRVLQGDSYPESINRDREVARVAEGLLEADSYAARLERVRFITQAVLVVLGTLQSSFGSLLVSSS